MDSTNRPPRRAVTRRMILEDSEDEESNIGSHRNEENDDSVRPPQTSPRRQRQSRRKTTSSELEPHQGSSIVKNENLEPASVFDTTYATVKPEPLAKTSSPRKRKSAVPRPSRTSDAQARSGILPTPDPSMSPEPSQVHGVPLADITQSLNDQPRMIESQPPAMKAVHAMDTILERPMDIVLKSRSAAPPKVVDNGPKARICITYLVLTNFKSYAGKQEVGPFHASFSSVVGPNGSGKSNVIDSLLFVFGFRASKMRQGKISALIHNSAAHPDLDYCEVAVHFQEVVDMVTGGHEVIPNSDLIISRRAFKNNASKYYINDKESTFTVVTTLLREKGVDLDHKRFLILQGEVESIAQMKPKAASEHDDGLLEYLEDIIGTSKYKSPIDESAAEVETLNEVCVEKSGRVQLVEKEKNSLEDKKDKAIAFIRDENELTLKQSALYQKYIAECSNNIAVTEETISEVRTQLESELELHKGNEDVISSLERQYKKEQKGHEIYEKETQSLLSEMATFDQEHVKFSEKRKFLVGKQQKLEKSINDSQTSARKTESTMQDQVVTIRQTLEKIIAHEQMMKEEEDKLSDIREELQGKTQSYSDEIAIRQQSLDPWREKLNQKQSLKAVAESELAILHEKAGAAMATLEDAQAKILTINEARAARLTELDGCRAERTKLEAESTRLQAETQKLGLQESDYRAKLSGVRQKADEARASLSSAQTQGNVLSGLMRLRDSGRVDGFHGRLGDLGTIDSKYDIAISTACGALDNYVTDTVEVGQQCIEYLRKTNLGRGSFICLDKLGKRDVSPIATPEDAPRLFDLVRSKDTRFLPAFYHSLQDTLVATDLSQANRIAYGNKRWRVVTLDGQLIDKSGTMSGGGTSVKKGLMSSKLIAGTTKEQVAKLENDRESVEEEFRAFQEKLVTVETALQECKNQIPQVETKIQKLGLEIESSGRTLSDAEKRLGELSKDARASQKDEARISALSKDITKIDKDMKKLSAETVTIESEIKSLQDTIMEVGGEKLRAQKGRVDEMKAALDNMNETISTAEVSKAKAEKQKSKHEKDLLKANMELSSTSTELEELEVEIMNHRSSTEESQKRVQEAQEALRLQKAELRDLKIDLDEKIAVLNEACAAEIELRNNLEENEKVLGENQKRMKYWTEKYGKLQLQDFNSVGEETVPQGLPSYSKDELEDMSKETLKAEIAALEEKTQNVNVELGVLAEYRRRVEEHAARNADLQTAVMQRDSAKKRCDELRRLRLEGFMEGFSTISLRLKEMYQMITMGGNAELELVDSLDPFSEGILFSVMPPKKSWKNISNLSGGEKTLSSLALVFALHHYKPTPLYVMDEIDAALDFRNVSIVASYIKERTKNAQFIVISLRNNMFELASRLVGVYKVNHMTKSVTIENRDYIKGGA